jgi:F0F1-type ATP synthase membrane subunit b/b'
MNTPLDKKEMLEWTRRINKELEPFSHLQDILTAAIEAEADRGKIQKENLELETVGDRRKKEIKEEIATIEAEKEKAKLDLTSQNEALQRRIAESQEQYSSLVETEKQRLAELKALIEQEQRERARRKEKEEAEIRDNTETMRRQARVEENQLKATKIALQEEVGFLTKERDDLHEKMQSFLKGKKT